MQGPGGAEEDTRDGFAAGGWAMPFVDETLGKVIDETIAGDFDLLLGRRTYDIFAGYWPHQGDNSIGKAFNRATKYVVTRRRGPLAWQKTERIEGGTTETAADGVRRLKSTSGPPLHVWGSGELLQALMAASLVDEHRLWVSPVVLGKGRRLFRDGLPARRFELLSSRSTPSGVLVVAYRPGGAPEPTP
jgi:dihydrofolate reductase